MMPHGGYLKRKVSTCKKIHGACSRAGKTHDIVKRQMEEVMMNVSSQDKIHKQKMIDLYNQAVQKYGISPSANLWNDSQKQYFRFSELIKHINLNDPKKSLLDIGCGNCELYKFLNFSGFRGTYTGFDINQNLLNQARTRFGNINVKCVDILEDGNISDQYNYVVMSGLFNVNVGQSIVWTYAFIKKMFDLCLDSTAFNAISTFVNYREDEMFYLDPLATVNYCIKELSPRVTLCHHNLPYNYTIIVFNHHQWTTVNDSK